MYRQRCEHSTSTQHPSSETVALVDSEGGEDNSRLVFRPVSMDRFGHANRDGSKRLQPSTPEAEQENLVSTDGPTSSDHYEAVDGDSRSDETAGTLSRDTDQVEDSESDTDAQKAQLSSTWKMAVPKNSTARSRKKQPDPIDCDHQRSLVGGLKIRFSLGPKSKANHGAKYSDLPMRSKGLTRTQSASRNREEVHSSQKSQRRMSAVQDSSCTDTDEDGVLIQRAIKAKQELLQRQQEPKVKEPKVKRQPTSRPRPGGVTLKLLIEEGLLRPGPGVLSLEYRGLQEAGDLLQDGKIRWKDMTFDSPSAFSIYVKRLVNPTRKADDGWKTVKFDGKYLDYYKLELARKRFGLGQEGSDTELDRPSKRNRIEPSSPFSNQHTHPAQECGALDSDTIAGESQECPFASAQHKDTMSLGIDRCESRQDADSNKKGLQGSGSDNLIHTSMFTGEASLLHPGILGI